MNVALCLGVRAEAIQAGERGGRLDDCSEAARELGGERHDDERNGTTYLNHRWASTGGRRALHPAKRRTLYSGPDRRHSPGAAAPGPTRMTARERAKRDCNGRTGPGIIRARGP